MRTRLAWILLAVVAGLLLLAAASGGIYAVLRQRQSRIESWHDPIGAVAADEMSADLALYSLAGASELETIDAAIANKDPVTAYIAVVFSPDLTEAQRIGRLILIARQFAELEKNDLAAISYQQIYDLAVLSPGLNDPARADALLADGWGWAGIGQELQALQAFDQVYAITVRSPYLQMAHRRDLLRALELAYRDLGDMERAEICAQRIVELDQEMVPQLPAEPVETPALPTGTTQLSSAEVGVLEESRRQAAFAVIQSMSDGATPRPDLVGNLAQALRAEDAAKLELYRRELEATTQPGKRVDLESQVIRWLTIKYRVAVLGFGLSLVPEWEEQAPEIQSALSKSYEDLFFDYEDLVAGLPDAALVGPGSYSVRRGVILAGRLGQYPNYPGQQLAEKLQDAARAMIGAGILEPLYVDFAHEGPGLRFFFTPADEYGQGQGSETNE